ncbi:MAG: hypothetical protein ABSH19_07020 [Opitutales bacterium]
MVMLTRGLLFLVVFAGCGWAYYYYYWQYRLPQERVLTDAKGRTMQVRLEGRADEALKFTLLSDGTMHYYPIAQLSPADQEFTQNLPVDITLGVPLDYVLTDAHGQGLPVRILGHNNDWVKYQTTSDQATHFGLISALSTTDQALVQLLPPGLLFSYPVEYTLTDAQGHAQTVRFLGHSQDMVKYQVVSSGDVEVQPIASLSTLDQSFVRQLPTAMAMDYPVDHALTDAQGRSFQARILGRSTGVVKFTLASDGSTQYYPLSYLSDADQKFLQQLPMNLVLRYPMDYNLTDQTGKTTAVRIEAGTSQVIKVTVMSDGSTRYYPIALLSAPDQKLMWQMQSTNLNLDYPLECSLTDQSGRVLHVDIEGRSAEVVEFMLMSDGTKHSYPLSKLSESDQAFLQMLPINLGANEAETSGIRPSSVDEAVVQNLLDQLDALNKENAELSGEIADPNTMPNDKEFDHDQLVRNRQEIRALTQQLHTAQGASSDQ